jgi:hypothetical protein
MPSLAPEYTPPLAERYPDAWWAATFVASETGFVATTVFTREPAAEQALRVLARRLGTTADTPSFDVLRRWLRPVWDLDVAARHDQRH